MSAPPGLERALYRGIVDVFCTSFESQRELTERVSERFKPWTVVTGRSELEVLVGMTRWELRLTSL